MRELRIANRFACAIAIMVIFLILAAPMEQLTTLQFCVAKFGAMLGAWCLWKVIVTLHAENKI